MVRAECFNIGRQFSGNRILETGSVNGFSTDAAMDQRQAGDLFPLTGQQVFEFNGVLGADPPAMAASGTHRDIVQYLSCIFLIIKVQGAGRAILDTGQASIACFIDNKKRHMALSLAKGV